MAIDWSRDQPPAWRHVPLSIATDMPIKQRIVRELHNAAKAYADAVFDIEHRLAERHFDAISRGDAAGADEALKARVAAGFEVA
jgi:hypothetical protein